MNIQSLYEIFLQYPSVQTDSRKVQKGDLFFALKGENFNGNLFAQQALNDGAAYAIVDENVGDDERLILTDNVLQTLQDLAKHHREQFNIPFLAITGSNGKTTTKELVNAVLSSHFKTYTTQGNFNNHIGIPLTILKVKQDAEIAVIEMGANHLKEIEGYCLYAQPTHGIITNIGIAHIEGFGSKENVRKAKGELYDFIRTRNGTVFAFDDYDYLHEMSKGIREIIWYGTKNGTVVGSATQQNSFLGVNFSQGMPTKYSNIQTKLVGTYNLPNVLCAVAVGKYFGVPEEKIKTAIENYEPSNSRSQLINLGTNKIILDAYNANPSSMKAAIENFASLPGENKVLILGGMKELGNESVAEHEKLINLINKFSWKSVTLIGSEFQPFENKYQWFENSDAARNWFKNWNFDHSTILIKGSRGIALEKLLS
ncbi:UDP-N-acetylmuramoylalanyl-D-glutamate--2,6-diaminopimelate ligase [Arachidicoccus ginsenosidimutans]|uniref:UDP-N-acetylmuramoyl-tripeptide--D-alanyl-D- alanine ligase n=1 Tax=Arachidicoccus sp. BS20 TaxID=1850526 RepID=UPI0007F10679|nr:UDP-N-acetylmuramoyl-tripeptide--D-alanyl-D-alanine ligase [Arachidicoccus sp. BS20]ANI88482.1 UDP-N-acetylmuramoylalanyl-D-glutamate--2,6-diaminopimelate ligase [Arachidicoccus sp. BS20]